MSQKVSGPGPISVALLRCGPVLAWMTRWMGLWVRVTSGWLGAWGMCVSRTQVLRVLQEVKSSRVCLRYS